MNETQTEDSDSFRPSELLLGYAEWKRLVQARRTNLYPNVAKWLAAWDLYDFAVSPMMDADRAQRRYGHYLGWFDRERHDGGDS